MEAGSSPSLRVSPDTSAHQRTGSLPRIRSRVPRFSALDTKAVAAFVLNSLVRGRGASGAAVSFGVPPRASRCFGCEGPGGGGRHPHTGPCPRWTPSHHLPLHPDPSFESPLCGDSRACGRETSLRTPVGGLPSVHPHLRGRLPGHSACAPSSSHAGCRGDASADGASPSSVVQHLFPLPQRDIPQSSQSAAGLAASELLGSGRYETSRDPAATLGSPAQHLLACGSVPIYACEAVNAADSSRLGTVSQSFGGSDVSLHCASARRHNEQAADPHSIANVDPLSLHFSSQARPCVHCVARSEDRRAGEKAEETRCNCRFLVAVGGVPGSGKSTLARQLAAEINRLSRERRVAGAEPRGAPLDELAPHRASVSSPSGDPQGQHATWGTDGLAAQATGPEDPAASEGERRRQNGGSLAMQPSADLKVESDSKHGVRDPLSQGDQADEFCVAVGIDGFHLTRERLSQFPDPAEAFRRRGAPWTLDLPAFWRALRDVKFRPEEKISFPTFRHDVKDPVPGGCVISPATKIVVVEGLYLGLKAREAAELEGGGDGGARAQLHQESKEWYNEDEDLFDITMFIDAPLEECERRVVQRHVAAGISSTEAEARERWAGNDALNAAFVLSHLDSAHLNALITQD
ncbi:uridine kinase [Besnoitia besnoiti]|uniref:Uridine kinase n=1 Tax=Besnoitia besnoiti TaxID=94643 RepID=A0A2A9MDX9_BESBE|nr:uridine kinase [Besnoitia besnoiti]PFH33592.1 uridine kinase [Besnoitia besnoiti]